MRLLFVVIFLPYTLSAQKYPVTYVDTVVTSGYFYAYMTIPPFKFATSKSGFIADYRFVPDRLIAGQKLAKHLEYALENEQIDKEKFLSQPPSAAYKPFEHADSLTLSMIGRLIRISPFDSGKQGYKFGMGNAYAVATHVNVKWLKLRVDATRAMFGFDNPATLDIRHVKEAGATFVYLPLEVISMDKERQWWQNGN